MADVEHKIVIRKQDRIDYILNGVCDYYNTNIEGLIKRTRSSVLMNRKRMTMKILYDIADLSLKDVAFTMGYNPQCLPTIHGHIAQISDDLARTTMGNKELKAEYRDILKHLKL